MNLMEIKKITIIGIGNYRLTKMQMMKQEWNILRHLKGLSTEGCLEVI